MSRSRIPVPPPTAPVRKRPWDAADTAVLLMRIGSVLAVLTAFWLFWKAATGK